MGRVKQGLRRLTKWPGVPQARHLTERSFAPYLRSDLQQVAHDQAMTAERLTELTAKVNERLDRIGSVSRRLNYISQQS
jgi:hypothetical protein